MDKGEGYLFWGARKKELPIFLIHCAVSRSFCVSTKTAHCERLKK